MRRILFLTWIALLAPSSAPAHDIKVFANKYNVPEGQTKATVYLGWGHLAPVDGLVDGKSIERFEGVTGSGKKLVLKVGDLSLQANAVELEAGINQVFVDRRATILTYVIDADGNKVAKRLPKSAIKEGKIDSSQRSVMCGKAILVAGAESPGGAGLAVKALGQAIEILPLDPVNQWRSGRPLRFQVVHDGRPLAKANLEASFVALVAEKSDRKPVVTGPDGMAALELDRPGVWALKVNTRVPAVGAAAADYDFTSFSATLTLEIRP